VPQLTNALAVPSKQSYLLTRPNHSMKKTLFYTNPTHYRKFQSVKNLSGNFSETDLNKFGSQSELVRRFLIYKDNNYE
jgi:hypothetical protein